MSDYHRPLPLLNTLRAFEAVGRKLGFCAVADELLPCLRTPLTLNHNTFNRI